jgi:hypothetical protein
VEEEIATRVLPHKYPFGRGWFESGLEESPTGRLCVAGYGGFLRGSLVVCLVRKLITKELSGLGLPERNDNLFTEETQALLRPTDCVLANNNTFTWSAPYGVAGCMDPN